MLTIASLFADPLALGMPGSGFGWKQVRGTVLGLVISAAGGYVLYWTSQADAADAANADADQGEGEGDNT